MVPEFTADIPPELEPSLVLPLEVGDVAAESRGLKNFAYARFVVKMTTRTADTMTCNDKVVSSSTSSHFSSIFISIPSFSIILGLVIGEQRSTGTQQATSKSKDNQEARITKNKPQYFVLRACSGVEL